MADMNVTVLHLQRSLLVVLISIFGLIIGHQENVNQNPLCCIYVVNYLGNAFCKNYMQYRLYYKVRRL